MTRRWGWQLPVRIVAAAMLVSAAMAGITTVAAADPPTKLSVQQRFFGAQPDVSVRDGAGGLVAAHQPGASTPAAAQPDYPQVTMTLKVKLPDNPAPSEVVATVVNTDDARKYSQTLELPRPTQRLSVPKGDYSVLVFSIGTDRAAHVHVIRFGFAVDQHVITSGTVVNIDLAAAQQDGFPTYSAPADATTVDQIEFYGVEDGHGRDPAGTWEIFGGPRDRLLVASTPGGAHGRLISWNETVERAAATGRNPYYLSAAHRNAVVGDEEVSVPQSALTRVERHYYTDGTEQSALAARTAIYPFFDPGGESFQPVRVPGVRSEYLFSRPGAVWLNDVEESTASGGFADMLGFAQYPRGGDVREDLWRGPLAPGVQVQPPGAHTYPAGGPRTCWVCRTATGMSVGLAPAVGSQPNYGGLMFAGPGQQPHETHLTVYRDGGVVFDGTNSAAAVFSGFPAQFATPSDTHDYRIVETANRAVDGMSLSTTARTEYEFSSSATSGPALDQSWDCGAPGPGPCTVLPLLSVQIPLPTSLTGTLPPGYSFLIANVGHVQGAAASAITGLRLAIRTNGSAWQPQIVEPLGGGRYYVAIHNTAAPGTPVDMRWHASDAAGSSITQSVNAAYTVEGS